jgi:hypothetical protein
MTLAGRGPAPGARQVCRHCGEAARHAGPAGLPEEEQKAVHTATGDEACEDGGRLAAPIDPGMTAGRPAT